MIRLNFPSSLPTLGFIVGLMAYLVYHVSSYLVPDRLEDFFP